MSYSLIKAVVCYSLNPFDFHLSKAGLLRWNVAPFLDNWLLDLPWVCSGSGTDLLGYINTLLLRLKFWYKFGYMLASTLGFKRTLFLGSILNNCLCFVIALLFTLLKSTASRSTNFPRFFSTSSDGSVFLDTLLF